MKIALVVETLDGLELVRLLAKTAIVEDLDAVAERFGRGYAGKLEGLERPVEWVQLDELELGLTSRTV